MTSPASLHASPHPAVRRLAAPLVLTVALSVAACGGVPPGDVGIDRGDGDPASVGQLAQALGEPVNGRPSHEERVALYACNRARVEPATSAENDWSEYPAVVPLQWHDNLAQAARAHSRDMRDTPCFQHNSCDGTDPFVRMKKYWKGEAAGTMGENIMAGINDGKTAIFNWIEEIGAPPGERGHRDSMFSSSFSHVGFGYLTGGTRYQGYWTQDFAGSVPGAAKIAPLACGSDFPSGMAGKNRTFGTVYYSSSRKPPDRVLLVLDGKAQEMALVKGKAAAGAYEVQAAVAGGCHRYYFSVTVAGVESMYPDAGTLGVDPDGTSTCADFVAGKVGGIGLVDPNAGPSGDGEQGGCRVGAAGAVNPLALLVPLALLCVRRRHRSERARG